MPSAAHPSLPVHPAPVLIVPGLNGSGPDHWQSRWEEERPDCLRITQDDWADPYPEDWLSRIDVAVRTHNPLALVAHSLGCLAVAGWAQRTRASERLRRLVLLLVAPCDADRAGTLSPIRRFRPFQSGRLGFRATVIASTNDPYAGIDRSFALARAWGAKLLDAGPLGHINAASGLGAWPFGQGVLDALIGRRTTRIAA